MTIYKIRRFSFYETSESSSFSSESVNGKPVKGNYNVSKISDNNGHITGRKITKKFSGREKVDSETASKGRISGVVQRKPNGSWGIISYKQNPPEWWNADYDSKERAEEALRAYQANKH